MPRFASASRSGAAAKTSSAARGVLAAGLRLSPQALGMAASVGAATLRVARRPRVALFSTGDELAMPGEVLKPGAIYNSNRFTLRALIEALGATSTRPRHRPRSARRDPRYAPARRRGEPT